MFTDDIKGRVGKKCQGFEDQHGGKGCGRINKEFTRTLDPCCGLGLKEKDQHADHTPLVEIPPRSIIFLQRYQA